LVIRHSSLIKEVIVSFFLHEARYRDLSPAAERLVTLCGAGALGANLAETLARMGLRHLRVIDHDRIEAHNLSTQPWVQQDVGGQKARVLANMLYRAVGARVEAQPATLTAANAGALLSGSAVAIDAFDNLPSRAAVGAAAQAAGIPCLHVALGSAGDYGCGLWDAAYLPLVDADISAAAQPALASCDYPLTRPLALMVAAAAAEVLARHLLDGSRCNFEFTLRDLRISAT
jgi:predicted ThiF/HesA family dinucleotide-utilizing enzyme